ncbi:MAG: putative signal transducing protein [Candidatus Acidiferrales bacterium]
MEPGENTVRVWVGLNPLQAKLMEQILLDNDIECFSSLDAGMVLAGGRYETSLWVGKNDEARARTLLETAEAEMSEALDQEPPADTES